jgi:2-amino-4-hydroxy-6-hydroxymethyldihydropteridine diphosphokinase
VENLAYLSIGSNIDAGENLKRALQELSVIGRIRSISSIWETEPVGYEDQPRFLNAVLALETPSRLDDLITEDLPRIERKLGRVRGGNKFGPRTIDLDLILFNDFAGVCEGHRIPSPEIDSRPFVGIPLAEIAGQRLHPVHGVSFSELASRFVVAPGEMFLRPEIEFPELVRPNS